MLSIAKFVKNFLLFFPVTYIFKPIAGLFHFIFYFNHVIAWIWANKNKFEYSDYFSPKRDYNKRKLLYQFLADKKGLSSTPIVYLEFGVASADSFKWWLNKNSNSESSFFGFDTFEGLPEAWGGFYDKGAMSHDLAKVQAGIEDKRVQFIKGLFQDTLVPFISANQNLLSSSTKKVIHLDADLYSATIFTLAQLYPFLHKGDIIMFDEFNVPLHEFKAYKEFTETYYVNLKPIGAVNNFYQASFEVV